MPAPSQPSHTQTPRAKISTLIDAIDHAINNNEAVHDHLSGQCAGLLADSDLEPAVVRGVFSVNRIVKLSDEAVQEYLRWEIAQVKKAKQARNDQPQVSESVGKSYKTPIGADLAHRLQALWEKASIRENIECHPESWECFWHGLQALDSKDPYFSNLFSDVLRSGTFLRWSQGMKHFNPQLERLRDHINHLWPSGQVEACETDVRFPSSRCSLSLKTVAGPYDVLAGLEPAGSSGHFYGTRLIDALCTTRNIFSAWQLVTHDEAGPRILDILDRMPANDDKTRRVLGDFFGSIAGLALLRNPHLAGLGKERRITRLLAQKLSLESPQQLETLSRIIDPKSMKRRFASIMEALSENADNTRLYEIQRSFAESQRPAYLGRLRDQAVIAWGQLPKARISVMGRAALVELKVGVADNIIKELQRLRENRVRW